MDRGIVLQYIVMDLEWNTAYCKRYNSFFNEVIEIGAVKLDESFTAVDTISIIIKPQIGKKLRGRTKTLTHITNEDVYSGVPYETAIADFSAWLGSDESTFLTWGDGDIRVLVRNNEYFFGSTEMPFISFYADAQKYVQSFIKTENSQQIGLAAACENFGIDPNDFSHHRALDDSLMTVECIKKVYDREKLKKYIHPCDSDFRRFLTFKPYVIKNINDENVNLEKYSCICPSCATAAVQTKKWRFVNQGFRSEYHCEKCNKNYRLNVRYKQFFDRLDEKVSMSEIKPRDNIKRRHPEVKSAAKNTAKKSDAVS